MLWLTTRRGRSGKRRDFVADSGLTIESERNGARAGYRISRSKSIATSPKIEEGRFRTWLVAGKPDRRMRFTASGNRICRCVLIDRMEAVDEQTSTLARFVGAATHDSCGLNLTKIYRFLARRIICQATASLHKLGAGAQAGDRRVHQPPPDAPPANRLSSHSPSRTETLAARCRGRRSRLRDRRRDAARRRAADLILAAAKRSVVRARLR